MVVPKKINDFKEINELKLKRKQASFFTLISKYFKISKKYIFLNTNLYLVNKISKHSISLNQ